jgi:hypothetical protein
MTTIRLLQNNFYPGRGGWEILMETIAKLRDKKEISRESSVLMESESTTPVPPKRDHPSFKRRGNLSI